ncbi:hypothetical protein QVD17_35306 [Tagetes erecta]|uniref:Peptidase S10, serine carboxypeptidase, Alpha/Beta hydrolase fold protein n=1 Tax=Tagetes erecta TaxID=13708 RepID=A0AAD8K399_TARER|nr:hypothetical protein QVD17_35306 [Tagetes erecta]
MMRYFVFLLILQLCLNVKSHSKSLVRRLPGYLGDLPFKLETGYVGVGDKEDVQLFYYFVESTTNSKQDPIIFYFAGGPGGSGLIAVLDELGPLTINTDDLTLTVNPYAWTQMASIVFVDIPAGTGFSYAETEEGWISSDTITAKYSNDFIKKFLNEHPNFLRNPLYVYGKSYAGIIVPKVALELYEGNERGDQQEINIKGYILCSPLTDKFKDINSRFEYAHRMALISDDIYKSGIDNCDGNYMDLNTANSACTNSLQRYQECTSRIYLQSILEPFCDEKDPTLDCEIQIMAIDKWVNKDDVQQALNVRQGKVGKVEMINYTLHYDQGKNDTEYYSYDIFSSFSDHKKLATKNLRAFIFSGDHDMVFPYVGVEKWIAALDLQVESPWKPFYVDDQVGGYVTKYAQNDYSLTYATFKGAGHGVSFYKPKQSLVLLQDWFSSLQTYSSDY